MEDGSVTLGKKKDGWAYTLICVNQRPFVFSPCLCVSVVGSECCAMRFVIMSFPSRLGSSCDRFHRRLTVSSGAPDQCGSGGTGRHTILRGWRRKAWGFKSPLPHHFCKHLARSGCRLSAVHD